MVEKVKLFIRESELLSSKDKILIAVSGGRDSIVLLMLLKNLKYNIEVAHCNYQLRGNESDADEAFVKGLCEKLKVPFHSKKFRTSESAREEGVSIQMKARELRYAWFNELVDQFSLTKITTAHHLDDQLETILINLTRGTGLKGLRGMKSKRDNIVRPLLCVSRDDINDFIYAHHIPFREDSSNASGKYFRNKIRHEVIPVLKEINPSLFDAVNNSTKRLRAVEDNWELQYSDWKKNRKIIKYSEIEPSTVSFIQQSLRSKGFSYPDIENALASKTKGRTFLGKDNWTLVSGDDCFELFTKEQSDKQEYFLDEELPIKLNVDFQTAPIEIKRSLNEAYINADKVQGKLRLRKWRQGDWFIPFGMTGKQKISDYFVNNKFSLKDKEDAWLLCDAEKVVWIIGHRSDNRYRIDSGTKNIFILSL